MVKQSSTKNNYSSYSEETSEGNRQSKICSGVSGSIAVYLRNTSISVIC